MGFPANNISRPGQPLLVEVEPGLTAEECGYEQDNAFIASRGGPAMTIQRVPNVPFAQIANSALRDRRLSFKARGVLALVLSNVGEWEATLGWLVRQSDHDGRHAVQQALNELTALGYRRVSRVMVNGDIRTVVEWAHDPEMQVFRPTENSTVGKLDGRETGVSIEHHPLEHHPSEDHQDIPEPPPNSVVEFARPKSGDAFDEFWSIYPLRVGKDAARRAWAKAIRRATADDITAGARRYRDDPNRDEGYTKHPATWLNAGCWDDDPLPAKGTEKRTGAQMYDDLLQQMTTRSVAALGAGYDD